MKRVVLALALCAASGFQKPTAARPGTFVIQAFSKGVRISEAVVHCRYVPQPRVK